MGMFLHRSWPITVKVPVAVASLMLLVGFVLSERVLSRLGDTQERHLVELSQSYLDGLSSAIILPILREDNWEIFDAITRMQGINKTRDHERHPVGHEAADEMYVTAEQRCKLIILKVRLDLN
jgi:hypothetical protein